MLDHLLNPTEPTHRDPDYLNPGCAQCRAELYDCELANQQDGKRYCDSCWSGFTPCDRCEDRIIDERAYPILRYVERTGKTVTDWFHEGCKEEMLAEDAEGA